MKISKVETKLFEYTSYVESDDEGHGHVWVEVVGNVDLPAPGQIVVVDAVVYPVLGVRWRIIDDQPVLVPRCTLALHEAA